MGKLHDAIGAMLCGELDARTEWDEPPQLYRLHVSSGVPRLVPVRIPLPMWEMARPPEVLAFIADGMADHGLRNHEADLHGMAFRHEGWLVEVEEPATLGRAEVRRTHEMALDHTLNTHPDRIEVRMLYAVDRAGITYATEVRRGADHARCLVVYPSTDPEVVPTGSVLDALDSMVQTLTSVELAPRVEPPGWLGGRR
jgi:hypothetical protein